MKSQDVLMRFKGDRSYIQGPDIFNLMMDVAKAQEQATNVRFSVHGFVCTPRGRILFMESMKEFSGIANLKARCQFDLDGKTHWLGLIEGSDEDNTGERYPYNEELIIKECRLEGETIQLEAVSPFTFIESIVAMNKHLLQKLFPDATGKWIFTRLDLARISAAHEGIRLKFVSNLNFRLTKSEVWVGDDKLGDIYFSVVNQ